MIVRASIDTDARTAIRQVALDYAEGWYTGDAARMDRAVHSGFVKRAIVRAPNGVNLAFLCMFIRSLRTRLVLGNSNQLDLDRMDNLLKAHN